MEKITFEHLPEKISELFEKIRSIESLLQGLQPPNNLEDKMLTISEAAILLNLAESTIYGKVSKMEIPVYKKGKKLYFIKEELICWLKEGKQKTTIDLTNSAKFHSKKT